MKSLKEILTERLELDNTDKAIIVLMHVSSSPELAYSVATGARNAVTARKKLEQNGFIRVNDSTRTATLTNTGSDILRSQNLIDDSNELTDRGQELIGRFQNDKGEWTTIENYKYIKNLL
jgi:predicted transcriptional regulator